MKMTPKTLIISNPASANGQVGRKWDRIYSQIKENYGGPFDVVQIERRGHATELSREAVAAGYELVVALGGDGTANEVVNGLLTGAEPAVLGVAFGFLPYGSGNDLSRSLGIPKALPHSARELAVCPERRIDVGKVSAAGAEGPSGGVRYFINVADFGAGGAVAEKVNSTSKAFGVKASYMWGILSTMISFDNPNITFSIDGDTECDAVVNDFIIANGRYFGGGLMPAPDAKMDDGLFDIVTLGDIGFIESVLNLPRLMRGTHLTHPKVRFHRGKRVVARAEDRVLVEAEGEVLGFLPATFEIIHRALRVKSPTMRP